MKRLQIVINCFCCNERNILSEYLRIITVTTFPFYVEINSILSHLSDAAISTSGIGIFVKGVGGPLATTATGFVATGGWPVTLNCGITFVGFVWLTASGKEITVMEPPTWAMGSTGVTTIGKIYDQDGNVISSIPGYTNPYGNVTTQNPAKDVGNGITLGPRPEDMAAGGMYTGITKNIYKVVSRIDESTRLVKEAEKMGKSEAAQKEADHLVSELLKGNTNLGIGYKNLFKDVIYIRGREGARVFYRIVNGEIEILGKANKGNEDKVIRILKDMYGK